MNPIASDLNTCLLFKLDRETFGVNVSKVVEILEMPRLTKLPKAPSFIRGVINLRGTVLPVVDARIKLGLPPVEDTVNTCIIVFTINHGLEGIKVGALVDQVIAVHEISESDLVPVPIIVGAHSTEYLQGMASQGDNFVMMLHVDNIFDSKDFIHLKEELASTKHKA